MRWWFVLVSVLMICGHWSNAQEDEQYRLVPGDIINIVVLNDQSLSGEHVIGPDGFVRLPLVGAIKAAGLTLDELTGKLQQALSRFIRRPRVTVSLKQFPASVRRVYVLGEVKNPGAYQIPPGVVPTILDAVALAGGFTDNADLTQIRVFQRDGQIESFNLREFQTNTAAINPGDLVWVPPAFVKVSIVGAVEKGGIYPVPVRGTLLDALAAAGSVKEPTATIRVFRSGMELLSVPWSELTSGSVPPVKLQEGDTILVSVPTITGVVVAGSVARPSTYDLKGNITVLGALALAGASVEPGKPLQVRVLRQGQEVLKVLWQETSTPVKELAQPLQPGDVVLVEPMVLRATLVGPVRKPGSYLLPVGSTIVDLLAKGEEILPNADLTGAYLLRKGESKPVDILSLLWESEMDVNLELQDGDVLLIPATRKVWVAGAVLRPGAIDYQPRMTVVDAISAAGGPISLDISDLSSVRIVSGNEVKVVNLEEAFKGGSLQTYPLRPGDAVLVPEKAKAYIYGAVLKPGAVRLQEGDTVLTALSNAGGPIVDARLDETRLIRFVNGSAVVMKLDLGKALSRGDLSQAPVMQPGDVLYIPPRRRSQWDITRVIGITTSLATAIYYLSRSR
ncbi:MAG: SLBB domain-containing protein [Armatimonadetes bacterium]|nr:SLBB domain-containing protein [Armatimonadota bacterium]MCX7968681.1 SLBB domain-containing protein [Armatimonadota bacterium]MDW8143321.1 SLBB domain-containing protein [Armatimonadota bacterium]